MKAQCGLIIMCNTGPSAIYVRIQLKSGQPLQMTLEHISAVIIIQEFAAYKGYSFSNNMEE